MKSLFKLVKKIYIQLVNLFRKYFASGQTVVIRKSGYEKLISKQLIITGGGSQLDGLSVLTKNYLDFETRIGFPKEFK